MKTCYKTINRAAILSQLLAFAMCVIVFTGYPQLDLWFSGLFFDPESLFYLKEWLPCLIVYYAVPILCVAYIVFLLQVLIRQRLNPIDSRTAAKTALYLLVVLALAPGLVVNLVFKEHFGRPRPDETTYFRGTKTFKPAFVYSPQDGYSFVSGHASFGFSFIAIAMVAKRHRKKIFATAVGFGILAGFCRIMQGKHFLSDVVFAFFFVYGIARLTHYLMFAKGFHDE